MNSYFAGPVLEKYVEEFSESQGLELELEEVGMSGKMDGPGVLSAGACLRLWSPAGGGLARRRGGAQ